MIRLTCTSCKATLEMDEAFAGGVCRCQHCGTIQTVPSHLKSTATAAPSYAQPTASKSLYQSPAAGNGSADSGAPSGLDELADVVASSGLSNSGLSQRRGGAAAPAAGYGHHAAPSAVGYQSPQQQQSKGGNKTLMYALIGGGAAVGLLVIVIVVVFALRMTSVKPIAAPVGPTVAPNDETPVVGPHMGTIPFAAGEKRVVYVLDRGDASKGFFDPLKYSVFKSIESLGGDREFQVIFWKRAVDPSLDEGSYPAKGLAKATTAEVDACRKKFEDLTASGATSIDEAIVAAMERKPDAIVIATPKFNLDDSFEAAVMKARGSSNVKIHTLAVGNGKIDALKNLSAKTGGTYREISVAALRAL